MAIATTRASNGKPLVAVSGSSNPAAAPKAETEVSVTAHPGRWYAVVAGVLFGAGLVVGLWFLGDKHPGLTDLPTVTKGTSVFAVLYVFAQAIERLLVPVSWFGGGYLNGITKKKVKQRLQLAQTQLARADTDVDSNGDVSQDTTHTVQTAADAQHDSDQYTANLTATTFGVASAIAFIASGYSGALLLNIAGIKVAGWLDLVVTGLAVAGGTKPLHDLISNVSSAKAGKS